MRNWTKKFLMTLLVFLAAFTIGTAGAYAAENEETKSEVSENDPSGNNPRDGIVGGFYIRFFPNDPALSDDGNFLAGGTMESVFVPEAAVSGNQKVLLPSNAFVFPCYKFSNWVYIHDGIVHHIKDMAALECGQFSDIEDGGYLDLYAEWTPKTYKIKYTLNGGENNSNNKTSLTIKSGAVKLYSPKKTGYTFLGWYKTSGFTGKVTEITAEAIEAAGCENDTINLYAKWKENKYNIAYKANGGKGTMDPKLGLAYSKSYKLPAAAFTRKGMTFTGWNTKSDGSGISIQNKATISKLASKDGATVKLYAQWKLTNYKITYKNMTGATNNKKNPATYTMKSGKIVFEAPKKTGFKFLGWYKDSKFKTKITSIPAGSTGNVTIYAKWKVNHYTIKFDANGGTGEMDSLAKVAYTKVVKLPENTFTKTGLIFGGWNTKADGSGTSYNDGAKVTKLVAKNKGSITLYAQWRNGQYKINFDGNGATSGKMPTMINLAVGKKYALVKNEFVKTGYTFGGWNTQKDGNGTPFANKETFTNLGKKDGDVITLYARWINNTSKTYTDKAMYEHFVKNNKMTIQGAAGLLGNLYAESGLASNNLENKYNDKLKMTDAEYTKAVDNGTYKNFITDGAGYGIAQWTTPSRKKGLLEYAHAKNVSISDTSVQLEYLFDELVYHYGSVYQALSSTNSVRYASNVVLIDFEKPEDVGEAVQNRRASLGTNYFKKFRPKEKPEPTSPSTMRDEDCPFVIKATTTLNIRSGAGTEYAVTGQLRADGSKYTIVHVKSGTGSTKGWGQLSNNQGWISLDYVVRVE